MKPPIFIKVDGGKFEIGANVLGFMRAFIQDTSKKTEAGGVLLGRHIVECTDIVVDEVTVPMAGDRRSRHTLYRGHKAHQDAIDRAWCDSGCTCAYLGEWHTHPESDPTPSGVDLRDWSRKLRSDVFDGDHLYFIIVGTSSLGVWEGAKQDCNCLLLGKYNHSGAEIVRDQNPE